MPPNAMADCVLPEEIMVCILTRFPVKSILRFKSVCKHWLELFSTPEFMKMHQKGQFSNLHKNQSFIVHRINRNLTSTISLFHIESDEKKPTKFYHPFSHTHAKIGIVGCCNGLFCIRRGQMLVLWNPALNLSMDVWPPNVQGFGVDKTVSVGFGYDAVGADFKVVRVICLRKGEKNVSIGVEVYAANSDSWTTIELDFNFLVSRKRSDLIVNGNPYWLTSVCENESGKKSRLHQSLVCFDVTNLVFKIVPRPNFSYEDGTLIEFVDWYGYLAALVCTRKNDTVESFDVWVFDDGEQSWKKNRSFGPIEVNVYRFLLCLKNGKFLGELPDGKLVFFHSESKTQWIEPLFYGPRKDQSFETYGYTESLAYIEGMEEMKLRG